MAGKKKRLTDIICEWDKDVWREDAEALAEVILQELSTPRLTKKIDFIKVLKFFEDRPSYVKLPTPLAREFCEEFRSPRLTDWEKVLPASNRKSCKIEEHYMSRYKQGWNDYRKEALSALKSMSEPRITDRLFIDHIQAHLKPNEEVICKICGKTAKEIFDEGSKNV